MISLELFTEAIELIKKKRGHENALCNALELCSPQEYVNAFIYSEYESLIVKMLKRWCGLADDDTVIDYWIYDLEFGSKFSLGCLKDNGEDINLATIEDLYNYIKRING